MADGAQVKRLRDVAAWNEDPKPFVWHKTADEILERLGRYCADVNNKEFRNLRITRSDATLVRTGSDTPSYLESRAFRIGTSTIRYATAATANVSAATNNAVTNDGNPTSMRSTAPIAER